MAKRKRRTIDDTQSQARRRHWRLGCFLGCLGGVLFVVLIIIVGLYFILRPLKEPAPSTLLTQDAKASFIVHLDPQSVPLKTVSWKLLKAYFDSRDETITYQDFDNAFRLFRFFVYPRIYVLLSPQASGSLDIDTTLIINFRRGSALFRYLIRRSLRDADTAALEDNVDDIKHLFVHGSLILSNEPGALVRIDSRLSAKNPVPVSSEILDFLNTIVQIQQPDFLFIGIIDNADNWLGSMIHELPPLETLPADSSLLTDFFALEEWKHAPFKALDKIIIRGRLLTDEQLAISVECFFNNPSIPPQVEILLAREILPILKDIIADMFVLTYSIDIRDSVLVLDIDLQQTAFFIDALFGMTETD